MKILAAMACIAVTSAISNAQDAAVEKALDAMQGGNLPAAEQYLKLALDQHPNDSAALDVLGVVLDQQKKYADADAVYKRAVAAAPGSASIRNNYGNHLLATGHADEARLQFLQAVKAEPNSTNPNIQLARLALEKKRADQALTYLGHLPPEDRRAGPVLFLSGVALSATGRYAEAEQHFGEYLNTKPGDFEGSYDLGLAAAKAGHMERAHSALTDALAQQPQNASVLYDLAVVDLKLRQNLDALASLSRAASIAPQRPDIEKLLAQTAAECGYFEDSIQAWDRYLRLMPDDEVARREKGFAQTAIGKGSDSGLAEIREFVRKHPNDAIGRYELGTALTGTDNAAAETELTRALQLNGKLTPALVARGLLRYRVGRVTDAVADFTLASTQAPHNGRILDRLGEAQLAAGESEAAVATLQKAEVQAPNDPSVLLHLGRALMKANQVQEANAAFAHYRQLKDKSDPDRHEAGLVEFLALPPAEQQARYRAGVERTVQAQPDNPEAQLRYLELLLQAGDATHAEAVGRKILALQPKPEILIRAANLLVESEQYAFAQDFAAKAIELAGPSEDLQLDLAKSAFHIGGPQAGLAAMDEISQNSRSPRFYEARAQMFRIVGLADGSSAAR